MDSLSKPRLLLLFVRHGERIDQVNKLNSQEKAEKELNPKCDPSLTVHGKKLAHDAGELTHSFISKY